MRLFRCWCACFSIAQQSGVHPPVKGMASTVGLYVYPQKNQSATQQLTDEQQSYNSAKTRPAMTRMPLLRRSKQRTKRVVATTTTWQKAQHMAPSSPAQPGAMLRREPDAGPSLAASDRNAERKRTTRRSRRPKPNQPRRRSRRTTLSEPHRPAWTLEDIPSDRGVRRRSNRSQEAS